MGLPDVLLFFREYGQTSGHFVHKLGCGRGTGAFIYAQSADETSPALAAFAPQAQPCFPAVSNALTLHGGNGV